MEPQDKFSFCIQVIELTFLTSCRELMRRAPKKSTQLQEEDYQNHQLASPSSILLNKFSIFLLSNGNQTGYKNGLRSNLLSSGV
jgi:hypothetical protein